MIEIGPLPVKLLLPLYFIIILMGPNEWRACQHTKGYTVGMRPLCHAVCHVNKKRNEENENEALAS